VAVVLLALGVGALVAVAHVLVGGALRAEKERAATSVGVLLARTAFESAVSADSDRLTASEVARLDAVTSEARTTDALLDVTVRAPSGVILYSPTPSLIGMRAGLDRYAHAALAGRVTTTPREASSEPDETTHGARIDVLVPLDSSEARVVALFELSIPYAPIAAQAAAETRRVDLVLLAAGLIFSLLAGVRLRRAGPALRTIAAQQHKALVRDLRRAIERGQLRLEYQPLAHLRSGHIRAVEALVRWEHPQRGLVAPAEFIPQAEQTAVIWALTEHILAQAIEQAARWRAQGLDLRVSVNIPGPCLLDRRLPGTLVRLLGRAQLPPDRLGVELTEESVIREPRAAREALLELRSVGIELVALDDFGTGYSSLTRLRDLPITGLKLDRSFLVGADTDADATLIAAITELAHKLGLGVVAEGIEDEPTWTRLAALGCDVGQGYWLSRPLRAEAVAGWMRGRSVEAWPQAPAIDVDASRSQARPRRRSRLATRA
jgi:EAL domain-containing protein (putative c-di-GMP-specific phosphodiesterase class I)